MTSNQPPPEEYTDGYVMFMWRRFIVDPRVLIPRLETEVLVKYCLKLLRENPDIQTVADIGTGSGIIPISIAEKTERPLQVFATDMSQEALDLAGENAQKMKNEEWRMKNDRITFLRWDLLMPLISHFWNSTPDEILITANLPYVREKEIQGELLYEPRMAFLGGVQTGFELYERFFDQLFSWKNSWKTCHVVIEFWLWQRDIAETILMSKNCSYTFFDDLRGIERFAHICLSR
jgi:release factor glutamine methyltransferase